MIKSEIKNLAQFMRKSKIYIEIGEFDNKKIRIEFCKNDDLLKFEDLYCFIINNLKEEKNEPILSEKSVLDLQQNNETLYFVSAAINYNKFTELSDSPKKIILSLALGSYSKIIEPYQKILALALLDYIQLIKIENPENLLKGKNLLEKFYHTISTLNLSYFFQRILHRF